MAPWIVRHNIDTHSQTRRNNHQMCARKVIDRVTTLVNIDTYLRMAIEKHELEALLDLLGRGVLVDVAGRQ